jgi:hypothetical protein
MKKFIYLVIIFIIYPQIFAQDLPKITPPSPEATSLAKFTDIPVNHYSGIPNISIPIYTIDSDGIKVPIKLSYHARGISVGEIASRVGLGWALSYGGSLSRQTRGKADEDPQYGFLNSNWLGTFFTNISTRNTVNTEYNMNQDYDFTPDVFNFSINGNSGKFIFDQEDLLPVLQKFDDVQITKNMDNGKIGSFVITDQTGFKYYFGKSKDGLRIARDNEEVIQNLAISRQNGPNVSSGPTFNTYNAWQLMDIENPKGDLVSFTYVLESPIFYRRSYDKMDMGNNDVINYSAKVRSNQYQLSEIEFNKGKVVFTKSSIDRDDLSGAFTLNQIKVLDLNNNVIKRFDFNYSYTTAPNDFNHNYYLVSSESESYKRLFLDSITEYNDNNESLPSYVFEYNSELLPNRFSNSQDTWGYYNGANNGEYLSFFDYGYDEIDRKIYPEKAKAGMLEKIKYPTGGSTSFTYEQNRFVNNSVLSNLITHSLDAIYFENKSITLSHLENQQYYNGSYYEKSFTVGDGQINSSLSNIWFTDESNCSENQYESGCKFRVYIVKNGIAQELYIGTHPISLSSGIYTLKVVPQGPHNPFNMNDGFMVALSWEEQENLGYKYAAGQRIKKIHYQDSNGMSYFSREYNYLDSNGNISGKLFGLPNFYSINPAFSNEGFNVLMPYGSVSGSPLSISQGNSIGYEYVTEYYGDNLNNAGKTDYQFTVFEDSGLYYEFPYHIPNDNEWLRGKPTNISYFKNNNGSYDLIQKVENSYLYSYDYDPNLTGFDGSTPNYLFPIPIYKYCNSDMIVSFLLKQKTRKTYRQPLITFIPPEDPCGPNGNLAYKTYHLTGGTLDLDSTKTTEYSSSGDIISESKYSYNYNKHYQVSSSIHSTSDSKAIIIKTLYPTDIVNPSVAESELISQHRLAEPIQSETYKDLNNNGVAESNELLSRQRTNYKDWDIDLGLPTNTDMVLPGNVQSSKGENVLQDRIQYVSYYNNGNVQEVSKTDGTHIVYIWGYQEVYPIAKIENATYSQVSYQVANLQTKSNNDNDRTIGTSGNEGILRTALESLRSSLPNAMVTTYTYDPLIGLTSVTDPKGYTSYYEHDEFNRLKQVKDAQGNILKENEYHYKNQ